jgi:hypothetical protein
VKEGAPGSPGNLGAGLNANGVRKQRKSNAGALEPGDGDGRTLRATMGSGIKPGRERKKSGRSIKSPAGSRGKDEFERGDSKVSLVDFSTNDSDSDSNSDDYEDVNDATSPKKRGSVVSKTDFNKMAAEVKKIDALESKMDQILALMIANQNGGDGGKGGMSAAALMRQQALKEEHERHLGSYVREKESASLGGGRVRASLGAACARVWGPRAKGFTGARVWGPRAKGFTGARVWGARAKGFMGARVWGARAKGFTGWGSPPDRPERPPQPSASLGAACEGFYVRGVSPDKPGAPQPSGSLGVLQARGLPRQPLRLPASAHEEQRRGGWGGSAVNQRSPPFGSRHT